MNGKLDEMASNSFMEMLPDWSVSYTRNTACMSGGACGRGDIGWLDERKNDAVIVKHELFHSNTPTLKCLLYKFFCGLQHCHMTTDIPQPHHTCNMSNPWHIHSGVVT